MLWTHLLYPFGTRPLKSCPSALSVDEQRIVVQPLSLAQVCFLDLRPTDPVYPPATFSCRSMTVFRAHCHFPGMALWISTLVLEGPWIHSSSLGYSWASFGFQLSHCVLPEASWLLPCSHLLPDIHTHVHMHTHGTHIRTCMRAHTHTHIWVILICVSSTEPLPYTLPHFTGILSV